MFSIDKQVQLVFISPLLTETTSWHSALSIATAASAQEQWVFKIFYQIISYYNRGCLM
jgi:hypothetical protein